MASHGFRGGRRPTVGLAGNDLDPATASLASQLIARLAAAGCIAAEEEASDLCAAAAGDHRLLEELVRRRVAGEPAAWVVGGVRFLGSWVGVWPGVFVPRAQSELLAARAIEVLPDAGCAVDLCTGSGAIAAALARARPGARVVASDVDPLAVRCARANGVEAYCGSLDEPLPAELFGRVDVVTAVVPYVPTDEIALLPRDVREHEPRTALDGGPDGTDLLIAAVWAARRLLRPGGSVLLELGGEQDRLVEQSLAEAGYAASRRLVDEDGDLRGIEAPRS